ncbi:MAG: GNAT family N-acetyltransferase [Deltaproteobacteria bacterium]|nr:GNAT family N-acetyltransferase [Deltaproteobacteria bacterium]
MKNGKHVNLVPFEPNHGPAVMSWFYDHRYAAFFRDFPDVPMDLPQVIEFFSDLPRSGLHLFVVILKETGFPIGLMTTECLKRKSGVFRFGIMLDSKYQRQIIAIECITLLGHHLIENAGMRKFVVEFLTSDDHIRRISEAGGFEREGVLKGEALVDGTPRDLYRYFITAQTFEKNALKL